MAYVELEQVKVGRYGRRGLRIVLPKSWAEPRGIRPGDRLRPFVEPDSDRIWFEPVPREDGKAI